MTIPNLLTAIRVLMIPILVLVYYVPLPSHYFLASLVFIVAALTDWLDGFLARRWKQTSIFGAFSDPVADKLIVAMALVILVGEYGRFYVTVPAGIIVGREIVVSALREWMAEIGKRAHVNVSLIGKFKTLIQMVAIAILLSQPPLFNTWIVWTGLICLYLAAGLTLWSMCIYLKTAWPDLLTDQISSVK